MFIPISMVKPRNHVSQFATLLTSSHTSRFQLKSILNASLKNKKLLTFLSEDEVNSEKVSRNIEFICSPHSKYNRNVDFLTPQTRCMVLEFYLWNLWLWVGYLCVLQWVNQNGWGIFIVNFLPINSQFDYIMQFAIMNSSPVQKQRMCH